MRGAAECRDDGTGGPRRGGPSKIAIAAAPPSQGAAGPLGRVASSLRRATAKWTIDAGRKRLVQGGSKGLGGQLQDRGRGPT